MVVDTFGMVLAIITRCCSCYINFAADNLAFAANLQYFSYSILVGTLWTRGRFVPSPRLPSHS